MLDKIITTPASIDIATMPGITMDAITAEIAGTVHKLKVERDTWQAVALQYKTAFEAQTTRLEELQDVCFATQAELENERAHQRKLHAFSDQSISDRPGTVDGAGDVYSQRSFGTALVLPRQDARRRTSDECNNPLFTRVQQCVDQRNYGSALVEIERLLRGPLSPKARAEGLLLKSTILRSAGPDELYDALAACSEALELCDRLADLESFLPRVQYQRGVLYYQLRMLKQARDAFNAVGDNNFLHASAEEYRRSCDDELELQRAANRRSGFDENRGSTEGLIWHLEEKSLDVGSSWCKDRYPYLQASGQASPYQRANAPSRCCGQSQANVTTPPLGELKERCDGRSGGGMRRRVTRLG
jgi:hypothetical protein